MIKRAQVDNSISGSPRGTPLTTNKIWTTKYNFKWEKNNHTYDCEYVICYKYNDSCHKRLGLIKQRERYSEMSALLQTLTWGGNVETADTSIQATWQTKFRLAKKPVPSQKTKNNNKKNNNKITDDEIVLFDFDFACNVTWYGLTTEKRQDKRNNICNLNELFQIIVTWTYTRIYYLTG